MLTVLNLPRSLSKHPPRKENDQIFSLVENLRSVSQSKNSLI
jgi:hypothetical protein